MCYVECGQLDQPTINIHRETGTVVNDARIECVCAFVLINFPVFFYFFNSLTMLRGDDDDAAAVAYAGAAMPLLLGIFLWTRC